MRKEGAFFFRETGAVVLAQFFQLTVGGVLNPFEALDEGQPADVVQRTIMRIVLLEGAGDAKRERAGRQGVAINRSVVRRRVHDADVGAAPCVGKHRKAPGLARGPYSG